MDETAVRGFDARVAVFPARRQTSRAADEFTVCVFYGGREFRCRADSAQIFLRTALLVAHHHETELVALMHEGGLELLLITDAMPFSIGTTEPLRSRPLPGVSPLAIRGDVGTGNVATSGDSMAGGSRRRQLAPEMKTDIRAAM